MKNLQHESNDLSKFKNIIDQYFFRKEAIDKYLLEKNIDIYILDGVVARGGLVKPLIGGTYIVNNEMLEDLKSLKYGEHASNLGAIIAYEIANCIKKPTFVVNPVVVDEFNEIARISGMSKIKRKSVFHALN